MSKTGESYTAARRQLSTRPPTPRSRRAAGGTTQADARGATAAMLVAGRVDGQCDRRTHAEWFAILDAWGATDHTHTEIARWLAGAGRPGWWTQNVTVAYERARGMRARHQMADGFSVSVTPDGRRRARNGRSRHSRTGHRARLAAGRDRCAAPDRGRPHPALRLDRSAVTRRRRGHGQGSGQDRRRGRARRLPDAEPATGSSATGAAG